MCKRDEVGVSFPSSVEGPWETPQIVRSPETKRQLLSSVGKNICHFLSGTHESLI